MKNFASLVVLFGVFAVGASLWFELGWNGVMGWAGMLLIILGSSWPARTKPQGR